MTEIPPGPPEGHGPESPSGASSGGAIRLPSAPMEWACNACGEKQTGPFEAGCQKCGNGTQRPQVVASAATQGITDERLVDALFGDQPVAASHWDLRLHMLTRAARLSIAVALARYADDGEFSNEMLPRVVTRAWAQRIFQAVEAEDQAKRPTPPTGTPKESL
jgi:hypothetical protein